MKKVLSIIGVSILSLVAYGSTEYGNVYYGEESSDGWYVWLNGIGALGGEMNFYDYRGNHYDLSRDTAAGISFAVGYEEKNWMLEFEGTHIGQKNSIDTIYRGYMETFPVQVSADLKVTTAMINAYYRHYLTERWSLYAGIGIGYGRTSATVSSNPLVFANSKLSASYIPVQYKIGTMYDLNDHWSLTAGLRMITRASSLKSDGLSQAKGVSNSLDLGLKYKF